MTLSICDVTTLVLCGGLGTRLRAVVADRPKALAEVAGRPFLHHQLTYLSDQGVRDVVLCTGYRADQIEDFVNDGSEWNLSVRYSRETTPLGTAGALKYAEALIRSSVALVLNGDTLMEADVTKLLLAHETSKARISIGLVRVDDRSRFGSVSVNDGGALTAFGEKGQDGPGWINAGVYLMNRDVLAAIPDQQKVSLETDVFPGALGNRLYGVPVASRFLDIGTEASYAHAAGFVAREED